MSKIVIQEVEGESYTWEEHEFYWQSLEPQGGDKWKRIKLGGPSGSTILDLLGESEYGNSQDEAILTLCGITQKEFSYEAQQAAKRGILLEDDVRNWRIANYGNVVETGVAVSKEIPYIRTSPDGLTEDGGLIEIKCSIPSYNKLLRYFSVKNSIESNGGDVKDLDIKHFITKSHFYQMQLNMFVYKRKWCDYVVFKSAQEILVNRIYYDHEFCINKIILPTIQVINNKIIPILQKYNIKVIFPPKNN